MPEFFVLTLGLSLAALYFWAFRTLPGEGWQFLASRPSIRRGADAWLGINFTFYGFFSATAYAASAALLIVLFGSAGVPLAGALAMLAAVLAVCVPASNLLVRWVEGKRYGFTVGGASFAGLLAAPLVLVGLDAALAASNGFEMPLGPCLAASAIAYVFGEGLGRLAYISFGCCYGKPVEQTSGWVRRFGERFHFVFRGKTKKIAFAAALDGIPVVPVQAMTAAVLSTVALAAVWLYYGGLYGWSLALALTASQLWRVYSETLRADFRGAGRLTVYQKMALVSAAAGTLAPVLLPARGAAPSLAAGLPELWDPTAILFIQGVWVLLFAYMGRSSQTGARLDFHVHTSRT